MRTNRTCCNLFESWTEYSAYILGFWWADGCIYLMRDNRRKQGYSKTFALCNTDAQIMHDLSHILDRAITRTHKPPNLPEFRVKIFSEALFDYCYALTGTTQKSSVALALPPVPLAFLPHFVRGYFDGDGSIHWVTYKNRHGKATRELRTSFTAGKDTGDFLTQLSTKLHSIVGTSQKRINVGVAKKLVFGQYDSALLCDWMYRDATLLMQRKKVIWDAVDKARLLASKRYHPKSTLQ